MDKDKIATVLEEAARGYRDEKYDWCTGAWVEDTNQMAEVPNLNESGSTLSACAEGALLHAAGFSWRKINTYGEPDGSRRRYSNDNAEGLNAFILARGYLAAHLDDHREKFKVQDTATIPSWNDGLSDRIYNSYTDKDLNGEPRILLWSKARADAKALVIEAMEATAKDLRNG